MGIFFPVFLPPNREICAICLPIFHEGEIDIEDYDLLDDTHENSPIVKLFNLIWLSCFRSLTFPLYIKKFDPLNLILIEQ